MVVANAHMGAFPACRLAPLWMEPGCSFWSLQAPVHQSPAIPGPSFDSASTDGRRLATGLENILAVLHMQLTS